MLARAHSNQVSIMDASEMEKQVAEIVTSRQAKLPKNIHVLLEKTSDFRKCLGDILRNDSFSRAKLISSKVCHGNLLLVDPS